MNETSFDDIPRFSRMSITWLPDLFIGCYYRPEVKSKGSIELKPLFLATCFLLAGIMAAGDADLTIKAWQAPNSAVLWRGMRQDVPAWELLDADGDGQTDVAVFFADGRYSRVEIDTDHNGTADRVYLFDQDGDVSSYLDLDGDGVLKVPLGTPGERQRTIQEIGHGGALFKKAMEMRFAADDGTLKPIEAPAPTVFPPFKRPAGPIIGIEFRLVLLPAGPPILLHREKSPAFLGEFKISAPAAGGGAHQRLNIMLRVDPTEEAPEVPAVMDLDFYPVLIQGPPAEGPEPQCLGQLIGHLRAAGHFDENFFFTTPLIKNSPNFLQVPVHDPAGRLTGSVLVEIVRRQ